MGQIFSKSSKTRILPQLLQETQIFAAWTLADVKELWKRFQSQIFGFALVEAQFETIISFKSNITKHISLEDLFDVLDNDNDGRIDGLEFLGGLIMCCDASFEDKARFCFEMFDFNLSATFSTKELVMVLMSCICGLNVLSGGGEELEPDLEVVEHVVDEIFIKADQNHDGLISYEEFVYWARGNRELMAALEAFNEVAKLGKQDIESDDSAETADESDMDRNSDIELLSSSMRHFKTELNTQKKSEDWKNKILEPTNYRASKTSFEGPDTNLSLFRAIGYRARISRNNLRYVGGSSNPETSLIVYPTAALAIIYDLKSREQSFYQGHICEITCLELHPSGNVIATADVDANIHLWRINISTRVASSICIIKGIVKEKDKGIQHLAFSPAGDRIASVAFDTDRTVGIYDISTGEMISSSKGLTMPNHVMDIAYSNNGTEIALAGIHQIKFLINVNSQKRTIDSTMSHIGKIGKKQTFYCIAYLQDDAIAGCATGELYRFKNYQCIQVMQAHGINEPVLSIYYNRDERTISTGSKDCHVKTWDVSLKAIGVPLDISEDLDGDGVADTGSLNSEVISVQHLKNRILIGTKGGEILEAILSKNPTEFPSLNRVTSSHAFGEIWGLAINPVKDEFATSGDDLTIRIWSLRTYEQTNIRVLPHPSRAVAYGPSGTVIALGLMNGGVALMEANSIGLKVFSTWEHSSSPISTITFSPDGFYLAVGSKDSNVYMYISEDKKKFRRQGVCCGHVGPVTHLDFSSNSQYLRSNGDDMSMFYWDLNGNVVKTIGPLRDMLWSTNTCVFSWGSQGILPSNSQGFVTTCMALPDVEDIVCGDINGLVKLYRYPSLEAKSLHQSYIGHSSAITCVRFANNRRFVISLGGNDRTILIWKHESEFSDDSGDDDDGYMSSDSAVGDANFSIDYLELIPSVSHRSPLHEAVNNHASTEELSAILNKEDENRANLVMPWKKVIVEPVDVSMTTSSSLRADNSNSCGTDVDFSLKWIHGYRCSDVRSNVLYSASGNIVYNAATVAIVYNKSLGRQKFLQGVHMDDIISIAVDPTGQFFATSEIGKSPSIVLWNVSSMTVLSRLDDCHTIGVSLLAFSKKGNLLASVGLDENNSLALHDWSKGIQILRTPNHKDKVLCLAFMLIDVHLLNKTKYSSSAVSSSEATSSADAIKLETEDVIVTGGKKHIKFWWARGKNIVSQSGLWGFEDKQQKQQQTKEEFKLRRRKENIICVASGSRNFCVTGTDKGDLFVWKRFMVDSNARVSSKLLGTEYPHASNSIINSIWAVPGQICHFSTLQGDFLKEFPYLLKNYATLERYFTCDNHGIIAVWALLEVEIQSEPESPSMKNHRLVCLKNISVEELTKKTKVSIKSICEKDGSILIGTQTGEIFEIPDNEHSFPFVTFPELVSTTSTSKPGALLTKSLSKKITNKKSLIPIISGHHSGEVWGLAVHPFLPIFITAGDDCTLRCWNFQNNTMISSIKLLGKARAVDILETNGLAVAIGLSNGLIWILRMNKLLGSTELSPLLMTYETHENGYEINFNADDKTNDATSQIIAPSLDEALKIYTRIEFPKEICPTQMIQVIKFSFNGAILAAGSHDKKIYIYDLKDNFKRVVCTGHTGFVSHFDFGVILTPDVVIDELKNSGGNITVKKSTNTQKLFNVKTKKMVLKSTVVTEPHDEKTVDEEIIKNVEITSSNMIIQSCSGSYELLYWKVDQGLQITLSVIIKNSFWTTWTIPFGWHVQGLWSPIYDGNEINAVCRSHTWSEVPVLASADEFGRLKIFNFPITSPGAPDKCYRGHSGHITNLCFSNDDSICISIGGFDKCVFVWETDIPEEIRELRSFGSQSQSSHTRIEFEELESNSENSFEYDFLVPLKSRPSAGDEFAAIKPWKSTIREPSDWKESPGAGDPPDASLELSFVYGYRGWDCRNNIDYANNKLVIIYHVAAVGIVLNTKDQRQIHNTDHDDDIISLAVHPAGHTVATGEVGINPKIIIWDSGTGVTIRTIKFHKKGVSHLAFSQSGEILVSCGNDDNRTIACHNVLTGVLIGSGKAGRGIDIYAVAVNGDSSFCTVGKRYVKFWNLPKATTPIGELSSKSGVYNNKSITARTAVSVAYLGDDAVTGMDNGIVVLWKERSCSKYREGHKGPVTAMCSISKTSGSTSADGAMAGSQVISGGKDGMVHNWNVQLEKVWTLNLAESMPKPISSEIQALATRDSVLLIGTKASEIFEVNMLKTDEMFLLVQGHFGNRSELWGLSTHPSSQEFVTASDDMTVRIWDSKTRLQKQIVDLEVQVRSVSYSPDGTQIAVATFNGRVKILSHDLKIQSADIAVSKSWIQVLQYSPNGKVLAVGSHDRTIYLLDTSSYSCRAKCLGHHSSIIGVDFSEDSSRLQSCSADYELLYWDCQGQQIKSATEMRDTKWATYTCILGWPVQGIWPSDADGSDINSVGRSPTHPYLATGDDSLKVKLFHYPSYKEGSQFKEYKGHSEHVTNVKFSFDGKQVFSAGGLDKAVLQFEVKINSAAKKS